jgi:antitoxin (DNA-binding transcriptional repressor) of toxin-antitoxin stability system
MDKAASLRSSDPDKVIAKGAIQFTKALEEAKAKNATDMLEFKHRLSTMPKETVVSAGELVTVMEGGRPVNKIFPEVIRLKTFSWTLPPGVPTEVPAVVAEIMRNKRRSEAETRAREEILQKNYEQPVLQQKWAEINKSYNSPTDQ